MILDKRKTGGKILQVLIGVVLTYLIFLLANTIMNKDKFDDGKIERMQKTTIDILDGFADSSSLSLTTFNTMLPYLETYLPLKPSVNIKGGSQFTYSFWLSAQDIMSPSLYQKGIFIMGDKQTYTYTLTKNGVRTDYNDFLVLCPYFGFGNNSLEFVIKFNTSNKVTEELYLENSPSTNDAYRKNIISILRNNWMMFTIIFEDNMPINDFENGIRVQVYLNEIMFKTGYFQGMLKQNTGNLSFFPHGSLNGVKLSNMKYFNYALNSEDVKTLYKSEPNMNKPASLIKNALNNKVKVDISPKNLLDYYNL